jgi:RNA polymerase sigma-70 factor (ECF subfamily)
MLDRQLFLQGFLRQERLLAAYLLSATGDLHAAEDLLQGVARILWEKLAEYDESRPFGAWALGIARLEVLKWRQQAARSREVVSEDAMRLLAETASEDAGQLDERYYFLAECLKALGATARRVLELKYAQGRKIADISACLEKSVPAVEMILVRSRRSLRACVERKMSQAAPEAL